MLPDLTVLIALLLGFAALGAPIPESQIPHAVIGIVVSLLSATWMIRSVANRALAAIQVGDGEMARAGRQWTSGWALLGYAAALFLFDWGALVLQLIPRITWLAPLVLLFLPAVWLFCYAWREQGRIDAADFARRGVALPPDMARPVRRGLRRHSLILLPLLLIYGITEGIWVAGQLGVESARIAAQWFEVMPLLALGVAFGIIFLALPLIPWLFHRLLRGQSLPDGRTRRVLEQGAKRIGLKYRDIVLWRTGKRVINAMVVGFTPGTRRIFLTDGLLETLTEDELLAVFFHEAGHAKRWHLPLLFSTFFSLALLFHVLQTPLMQAGVPPFLIVLLHLAALWFGVLGFVSRRFEREADLYGAEHAAILTPDASSVEIEGLARPIPRGSALMMRALDRLRQVSGRGTSHRHGTIESRMQYIAAHATDPSVREAWHRDRRNLLLGIIGLLVLSIALVIVQYPVELATARARIRFEQAIQAQERAESHVEAGRLDAARPHWQEAYRGFVQAAAFVEGESDPAARDAWLEATWHAGETAFRGLREPGPARTEYEALRGRLAELRGGRTGHQALLFETDIELGRIAAWEGRPRDEATQHLRNAQANPLRHRDDSDATESEREADEYRTERLRLLEATIDARLGGREGAEEARPKLALLTKSANDDPAWAALRADAKRELERLADLEDD